MEEDVHLEVAADVASILAITVDARAAYYGQPASGEDFRRLSADLAAGIQEVREAMRRDADSSESTSEPKPG